MPAGVIVQQHVKQQQSANMTAGKTVTLYVNRNKWQIHHGVRLSVKMQTYDSRNKPQIHHVVEFDVKMLNLDSTNNS